MTTATETRRPMTGTARASALTPTHEQARIIEAARGRGNLVIEAGAGTGKTSTLRMLAGAMPERRGIYVAYNRAIADEAKRTFPGSVVCATAHSFAFGAVGRRYIRRLNGPRMSAHMVAKALKTKWLELDNGVALTPTQVARVALDTVMRFCHSADERINGWHVPHVEKVDDAESRATLREAAVRYADAAWADLTAPDGVLKFQHDHYLKLWQLSRPRLECDYLLLDEAQDSNPVVVDIMRQQTHAQIILVGDESQAIYGWRGAFDAMREFHGDRLVLSQSFRFGPAVATEANKWLGVLRAPLRLSGFERIPSKVGALGLPRAILCRTNAEAIFWVMRLMDAHGRVALAGGGAAIRALAYAAMALQDGKRTDHPELMAFTSWDEVREHANQDSAGADLKVFVRMIDQHGPDLLILTTERLTDARYADVVVSTAHKAKGLEWDTVRIASDFKPPKRADGIPPTAGDIVPAEAMLAYVAVTRAKLCLDREGLAWIDEFVGSGAV